MSGREEILKDISDLEKRIKKIYFIDQKKYGYFKGRITELEGRLLQDSWEDVYKEYLNLENEYTMYMEVSIDKYDLVLDLEELTAGKDKIREQRINLLEEISSKIYKGEISVEKLNKLKELWDKEIDENEYDEVELRRVQKAFAKIFLAYQIRYVEKNKRLPEEKVEEYCDIEAYENEFEDRIIEMLSSGEVDSKLKGEIGLLFLQGGKNQLPNELFKNKNAWELLTGVRLELKRIEGNNVGRVNDNKSNQKTNVKVENLTFLTKEQIFGDKQLDILRKRGTKASMTDFAILLGGVSYDMSRTIFRDNSIKMRLGRYWTKSSHRVDGLICTCNQLGEDSSDAFCERSVGARLVLPFSSFSDVPANKKIHRFLGRIQEVEYGYYPRGAVDKNMQDILEQELNSGILQRTGNGYTTDSVKYDEYHTRFQPQRHKEYEYDGKRYVRVKAKSNIRGEEFVLSNGEIYEDGDYVWVKVEPVKWLVDEKAKIMITKDIVFAGVQFNRESDYKTRNFDTTDIKQFMDEYFAKDLVQIKSIEMPIKESEKEEGR